MAILEHPIKGSKIVAHIPGLKEASNYVRYHHEWFDGSGYPFGLRGSKIPLGAQIIRLADAVDITCSDIRNDAVQKMAFLAEFDPDLVRKAELVLNQKRGSWLGRHGASSACLS